MDNSRDNTENNQRQFSNSFPAHVFSNPDLDFHLFEQIQNPNTLPPPSLEDAFSRMNLNNLQNTRTGSAIFPSTFMGFNDYDVNSSSDDNGGFPWSQNSFYSLSSASTPSMFGQRPVYYPLSISVGTRDRSWSLMELKGRVCALARDQNWCRFLQKRLDCNEGITPEEIDMIFMEVKYHLHELMVHQFANYLIQKLFKAINEQQSTQLLILLVHDHQRFFQVCTDVYGSRTVQKFMERITKREQMRILLSALKPIVVILTNNGNGHHIIQQCLYKFPSDDITLLMDEIVRHCLPIATNKNGCCVLQQCLTHANPDVKESLLKQISANALLLSEDEFGNYVVQFVVGMRYYYATSEIISQLEGSFVSLSINKYGSHVVERCLKQSGEQLSSMIISEIINHPDFVKVLGHDYGNYVVQSALLVAKGDLRNALLAIIRHHYSFLQSSPFGRRVLSRSKHRKNNHI